MRVTMSNMEMLISLVRKDKDCTILLENNQCMIFQDENKTYYIADYDEMEINRAKVVGNFTLDKSIFDDTTLIGLCSISPFVTVTIVDFINDSQVQVLWLQPER